MSQPEYLRFGLIERGTLALFMLLVGALITVLTANSLREAGESAATVAEAADAMMILFVIMALVLVGAGPLLRAGMARFVEGRFTRGDTE